MVEIERREVLRDFVNSINARAEYIKFLKQWDVEPSLKRKVRQLRRGAFVDEFPKDYAGDNKFLAPSYYLRWGFEKAGDHRLWSHNYIIVAVAIKPQYRESFAGPDGKLEWRKLAEEMAYVMAHEIEDPQRYLCLTITDCREAKIVPDKESLQTIIEDAVEYPLSVSSYIGPRQTLWNRLRKIV